MAKTGFGRSSNDLNSSLLDDSEIGNDKFTDSLIESSSSSFNVDDIANSASLSMFLLLNAMIGSGILNQPYVFSQSGLIGGVAAFIVAAFFTWGGLMLLTETGISRGVLEYSGLTKKVFGKIGEQAVDFFIVIQAFGSQVGYILVVGQTTTELLNGWGCENAICGQYSTTIGTTILFVTPVCLLRHLGHLAILSLFSILAIVLCMALVVIGGPVTTKNDEKSDVVIFDVIGMLGSAGSIVFALSCAPANFQAFVSTEKKSQNVPTWTWVTGGAVILGAIMCMIMGICKCFILISINILLLLLSSFLLLNLLLYLISCISF